MFCLSIKMEGFVITAVASDRGFTFVIISSMVEIKENWTVLSF